MAIAHICLSISFPRSPKQLYIQIGREKQACNSLEFYYDNQEEIGKRIILQIHLLTLLTLRNGLQMLN